MAKNPNNNNIVIAGDFTAVNGTINARYIAQFNKSTGWTVIGNSNGLDLNGTTRSIAVDSSNNIYVGGNFTTVRGASISYIAKYTPSTDSWSSLGSVSASVTCIAINSLNHVYFTSNGVIYKYISGTNNLTTFATLSSGGYVDYIVFDKNDSMYVCGNFTSIGGTSVNSIAKHSSGTWTNLGSGLGWSVALANREIYTIIVDSNLNVYVSGTINSANGTATNSVAVYKNVDSQWHALGQNNVGLNDGAYTIEIDSAGYVYFAGAFTSSGTNQINRIAKYDPVNNTFSALQYLFTQTSDIYSMKFDSDDKLYIGGPFQSLGYIAQYNS
jgi:hypothetical protein